jgi:hypothetical protein
MKLGKKTKKSSKTKTGGGITPTEKKNETKNMLLNIIR